MQNILFYLIKKLKSMTNTSSKYNNWFSIQDVEESDDKTIKGNKEETVDKPFMPLLKSDEEQVKEEK